MRLEQIRKRVTVDIPHSDQAYMSEAFNTLRANLLFCDDDIKSIAMVSCTSGEGTTDVTWRLAFSLSEIGKNVLVIDGNMRNSSMKYKGKGLSDYLSGDCRMQECIFRTPYEHLYVLPSGDARGIGEKSSELLLNDGLRLLLNEAEEIFDYIFVDCPPLSDMIDGAVVAGVCNASAIVLESDRIKPEFLQNVTEQLRKANDRILGVIINRFNVRKYRCYGNYLRKSCGRLSGGQ